MERLSQPQTDEIVVFFCLFVLAMLQGSDLHPLCWKHRVLTMGCQGSPGMCLFVSAPFKFAVLITGPPWSSDLRNENPLFEEKDSRDLIQCYNDILLCT